ncbi:hypothetical protein BS47DRAFT_1373704 [Hydnum rufescens UP504]|uniref:Fumarate lyase N-terminal domain-containing protein n=1 Tax=Hydnum rufescens UP504 TaxID=1448309 RepID=A0A9P6DNT7_9AGAM|nr:hypothetical protein BS47DRAFT_1373704 [Hydnum rufescens UP504]
MVPATRHWGPDWANFDIGGPTECLPLLLTRCSVKKTTARLLVMWVISGKLIDEFPLVVFQTGSGTQSNMSANKLGSPTLIHPNDHVNMSQSNNDASFPDAAMRIATAFDHIKIGRTHLQDAAPFVLAPEFTGYVQQAKNGMLEQGGTALSMIAVEISNITGHQFISAHGALNAVAVSSIKIANDIRCLWSGPRCGLGLSENEQGSSVMPGEVNPTVPTQCEALTMVAAHVMGSNATVSISGSTGRFEVATTIKNVLQSIRLRLPPTIVTSLHPLTRIVVGIQANEKRINQHVNNSGTLATILNSHMGYDMSKKATAALGLLAPGESGGQVRAELILYPELEVVAP